MGELLIVSKSPSDFHPEGRHYVTQTIDATVQDSILTMRAAIIAIGNNFEEAKTIVSNLK